MFTMMMLAMLLIFGLAVFHIRRTEQRTHLIRSELQDIMDALEPLALVDQEFRIIRINRAFRELVGKTYRDILRSTLNDVFEYEAEHLQSRCEKTFQEQLVHQLPNLHMRFEGRDFCYDVEFHPVHGDMDQINVLMVLRDASQTQIAEEQLRTKNLQILQRNNELKRSYTELHTIRCKLEGTLADKNEEFRMAREIQKGLMPEKPSIPGMLTQVEYMPANTVGGDYFDLIPLDPNRYGILIADVAGHGLAAAFIGALTKMALNEHISSTEGPDQLLEGMNRSLRNVIHTGHYVTAFFAQLDISTFTLTYSCAGHPPPLLIRANGTVESLSTRGFFLGVFAETKAEVASVQLEPGDRLIMYTDGCYELSDMHQKQRLRVRDFEEVLAECALEPVDTLFETAQRLLRERIIGEINDEDDRTFWVIERPHN